jgi:hypothetical protein
MLDRCLSPVPTRNPPRERQVNSRLVVRQDVAPVLRLKDSGDDQQALVLQQADSSIDHLSNLAASQ